MKTAAICLTFAFGLASSAAAAQGADEAMEKLRACSLLAPAERLDCLDRLSHDISPLPPPRPAADPSGAAERCAESRSRC